MATLICPEQDTEIDNQRQEVLQDGVARGEALRLVTLGLVRYKAKDMDGAVEAYGRAVATDPTCQEAQERLLYALQEREDILSEVRSARERLASRPGDVQERFRLAQRLEPLGRWEEAVAEFAEVVRIDGCGRWGKSARKISEKMSGQHSRGAFAQASA